MPGRSAMKVEVLLKDLLEINNLLLTLVSEAKFEFRKDGLFVSAVDPSHVAMLVIKANKDGFKRYEIEKDIELGLDLDKVKEFLKLGNKGDTVEIEYEGSTLVFYIQNLRMTMGVIDVSGMNIPKVPEISFSANVVINRDQFELALRSCQTISDHVTLKITPESFEISTVGESSYGSQAVFDKDSLKEISCEEEVRSSYPIDYLLKLVKQIDSAEEVKISMSSEYPVKIDFEIMNGHGTCSFLLAPRIEE